MDSIYFLIDKPKYRQLRAAHRVSQLATVPPHVKWPQLYFYCLMAFFLFKLTIGG